MLGSLFGALGGLWGPSRDALGRSWGALGMLLGRSWGHVGPILQKNSKKSKRIRNFDPTWEPKWRPKSLKIDVKGQHVFKHVFFTFFFNFSSILDVENRWFFDRFLDLKRKRRFCKNKRFASTGARFLRFWNIKNQQKINAKSIQK